MPLPRISPRLFFVVLLLAVVASCTGTGGRSTPFPPEVPRAWARPLTDRVFERTETRRARGEYLAEHLLQCALCHSERDWSTPGAPPKAGKRFAGAIWREDSLTRLVAANLTPDPKTGAGRWTDDMLARAIREGVGHDGRALHPQMWYSSFRFLSDEDLASVVVYLRSLPPVMNALPPTRLTDERRAEIEAGLKPLTAPVPEPDRSNTLARGRYLAVAADCAGCHTSFYSKRMPGTLAGGNWIKRDSSNAFSVNITPDPSGIGAYDAATFREVIRSGKGGLLHGAMPWIAFAGLTDLDLDDLHALLRTMAPVSHYIDNHSAPTHCVVCEQTHGMGEANRIVPPRAVRVDPAVLARYVGEYHCKEFDFTRRITLKNGRLFGSEDGAAPAELIPLSPTRFLLREWLAPIEFHRNGDTAEYHMTSIELDDVRLYRVDHP